MKKIIVTLAFVCVVAAGALGQTTADEWLKKANEYFESGDYTNAITVCNEAIKRDSTNINAYNIRGMAYHNTKNYNAAIADYTKVITDYPNYHDAYSNRGNVYIWVKNYDAAITDYNIAIIINSDFPSNYVNRGYAYGAKGLYHKAIEDYRQGFEKDYDPSSFIVDKSDKSYMWFCGAMYMEIAVNRFLGKSDVVAKYENWLNTVCNNSGVTRAEVEKFYRDNVRALIAAVVDEEFNRVNFFIQIKEEKNIIFHAILTRNPQTGQLTLSYGRSEFTDTRRGELTTSHEQWFTFPRGTYTASTPEALLSEISRSDVFEQGVANFIRAEAAQLAFTLSEEALSVIKNYVTNFFITPNATTYAYIKETYTVLWSVSLTGTGIRRGGFSTRNEQIQPMYKETLSALNNSLAQRVLTDAEAIDTSKLTTLTPEQQQRLKQLRNTAR